MNCIDFCVIFKYCVKQLMIFGHTVVAASDLKNCTMVNCDLVLCTYQSNVVKKEKTRFDVYETLCPQQMLVHKGGQIKNWSGECRDVIPTKLQCQAIQRALQSPNLQREIIRKK